MTLGSARPSGLTRIPDRRSHGVSIARVPCIGLIQTRSATATHVLSLRYPSSRRHASYSRPAFRPSSSSRLHGPRMARRGGQAAVFLVHRRPRKERWQCQQRGDGRTTPPTPRQLSSPRQQVVVKLIPSILLAFPCLSMLSFRPADFAGQSDKSAGFYHLPPNESNN